MEIRPVIDFDVVKEIFDFMFTLDKEKSNNFDFVFKSIEEQFPNISKKELKNMAKDFLANKDFITFFTQKYGNYNSTLLASSSTLRSCIDFSGLKFHYIRFETGHVFTIGYLYIPLIKSYVFTTACCSPEDEFRKSISRDKIEGRIRGGSFIMLSNILVYPEHTLYDKEGNVKISETIAEPGITSFKNVMYSIALNIIFHYYNSKENKIELFIPYEIKNQFKDYLLNKFIIGEKVAS